MAQSTLFPVDSLANLTVQPGSEKALKMNATSGQKCLEQYAKADRAQWLGKTCMAYLARITVWRSRWCVPIWKVKDTRSKRLIFRLELLVPPTDDTASGLLPTPQTQGLKTCDENGKTQFLNLGLLPTPAAQEDGRIPKADWTFHGTYYKNGSGQKIQSSLSILARNGLLPTPKAREAPDCPSERRRNQPSLDALAGMGMLPTPTASDWKGGTDKGYKVDGDRDSELKHLVSRWAGKPSQLNPRYVATMMGYPPNWTELPFLNGAKNPLQDMETP